MLEIRDLHVRVEEKPILRGVDLVIRAGEVHAVMARTARARAPRERARRPRGLRGHPGLRAVSRQGLLSLAPEARARAGVFLAFQYPVEIPASETRTS